MDDKIRAIIENTLDKMLTMDIASNVKWIESTIPIKSLKDLAIGFFIGGAISMATTFVAIGGGLALTDRDKRDNISIVKRRLPEIVEKIEKELHR